MGSAYADVNIHIPSNGSRHAWLEAVSYDDSAASVPAIDLSLFEVEEDAAENNIAGDQLFYADYQAGELVSYMVPRLVGDDIALRTGLGTGRQPISTGSVRCHLKTPASGLTTDVYTVVVYYETSGDYRFKGARWLVTCFTVRLAVPFGRPRQAFRRGQGNRNVVSVVTP
jgi:hypothetical protein